MALPYLFPTGKREEIQKGNILKARCAALSRPTRSARLVFPPYGLVFTAAWPPAAPKSQKGAKLKLAPFSTAIYHRAFSASASDHCGW
jgi:hypothetical protein